MCKTVSRAEAKVKGHSDSEPFMWSSQGNKTILAVTNFDPTVYPSLRVYYTQ